MPREGEGLPCRYLGSTCSPCRYSSGYTVLRGCPGSAMPSGGDTGSIPSSLLPKADVLLGSGDLGGERVPVVVRAQGSLLKGGASLSPLPAKPCLVLNQGLARFSCKGSVSKHFRRRGPLVVSAVCPPSLET